MSTSGAHENPVGISKNTQIPNFLKIRPVGVELFHADGQDEAKSRFSQFCERS
jgi:hypothetical protein